MSCSLAIHPPRILLAIVACVGTLAASVLVWGVGLRAHLENYCFGTLRPVSSSLGEDQGLLPTLSGPVTLHCSYDHSPDAQATDWYPLLWTAAWVAVALIVAVVVVQLARRLRAGL